MREDIDHEIAEAQQQAEAAQRRGDLPAAIGYLELVEAYATLSANHTHNRAMADHLDFSHQFNHHQQKD